MAKTLYFSLQNTVDCYSISLNGFLFYFIGKKSYSFPHKTLLIAAMFFSHGFFSFQNYLCWFFFNIKLVDNLVL